VLCEICKRRPAFESRTLDRGYGNETLAVCFDCAKNIDAKERHHDFTIDFWGEKQKITECAVCGTSLDSILSSGYVGCATCYRIFSKEISDFVVSIQGKNSHVGKVPLTIINKSDEEADVAAMMDRALETGDFRLADKVRNHFPGRRV